MGVAVAVPIGDSLPLKFSLHDGATDRFVRAVVKDNFDVAVAGSPFTLTHKGDGLYKNDAVAMPDKRFVYAVYIAFDDALFVTESDVHGRDVDCFFKDILQEAIDDLKQAVKGIDLVAEIDDGQGLVAEITSGDDQLVAVIDDNALTATITEGDEGLEGTIDSDTTLQGELEC